MKGHLFLFFALLILVNSSKAENYAFIVGIGGYDEKQLDPLGTYPRNDAIEFRDVLIESGFRSENIVLMVDDLAALPKGSVVGRYLPEAEKIRKELQLLLPSLERDDSLIIALAGHGVQFKGDDQPYFCPLDAKLDDKDSLISLTWLYDQLKYNSETGQGCQPRQKLLLIDACRNDPASKLFRDASDGPGLASVTLPQLAPLPEGVVALFSCAEGQQALQHDPLKHGVFFYHVLEGWKGKADGDMDQVVTLDEVIAFTKSQTKTYARLKLAAPQTPRQKGYFDGIWELRSLQSKDEFTNSIGMKLKLIPAGSFMMGSDSEDAHSSEQPVHRVQITQPFYMQKTEVTQGQWQAIMGTEPWKGEKYAKEGNNYAASYVSWDDAVAFCEKLSQKEGKTYRLPTEAEWEYACRAGSTTEYSFGDDGARLSDYAWWGGLFRGGLFLGSVTEDGRIGGNIAGNGIAQDELYPHRVSQKLPNAFGLYDMLGNVCECCSDWYDEDYYANSPAQDPQGPRSGSSRVVRGGSWYGSAVLARSAYRFFVPYDRHNFLIGFRVVRE